MPKIEMIFSHESASGGKGELGIDEGGKLYWNEKAVVTEQQVKLSWWVNCAIIVGGFATLIIAVFEVLMYFKPSS
ncbi:hypothetical protein DSCW_21040 [Desulfosarcina widdelii]|uniref:Uncharacterized protein n=1 Tax=Desulfosarcina widdelii TaxID=947919 RepID=A0A5K7ZER7_9BACT|nr:hypothetical protein [Desulfosarcina widdelii]BBO74687.1 hypothetical protein DSCW_21040 [Desulfosarcina widdelii]